MLPLTGTEGPPLDHDRLLALSYVPAARREAIGALWRLDAALGAVLSAGRDPLISRIKLAWWRDALEALDPNRAAGEPVLQTVADHVLPAGVKGGELARMEEGWAVLLSSEPLNAADLDRYAAARGGFLFSLSARVLGGGSDPAFARAGESWALADLARHSGSKAEAEAALEAGRARLVDQFRWPARLRPLGMLAALARRDLEREAPEPQGAPKRMLRMLRHRLTGF